MSAPSHHTTYRLCNILPTKCWPWVSHVPTSSIFRRILREERNCTNKQSNGGHYHRHWGPQGSLLDQTKERKGEYEQDLAVKKHRHCIVQYIEIVSPYFIAREDPGCLFWLNSKLFLDGGENSGEIVEAHALNDPNDGVHNNIDLNNTASRPPLVFQFNILPLFLHIFVASLVSIFPVHRRSWTRAYSSGNYVRLRGVWHFHSVQCSVGYKLMNGWWLNGLWTIATDNTSSVLREP